MDVRQIVTLLKAEGKEDVSFPLHLFMLFRVTHVTC